jgi:hypothetical protein
MISRIGGLKRSAIETLCSHEDFLGDPRHHLSPSVELLAVYLENQKVILVHSRMNLDERLNQSSSGLERDFYRPQGDEYKNLTYPQYFSLFQRIKRNEGVLDGCPHRDNIVPRRKAASYIIKDTSLKENGHFYLRFFLLNVPTRSRVQLRTVNQSTYDTFAEGAREHDMVLSRQREVQTALLPGSDYTRSPGESRFIVVLAVESAANDQLLFDEFNDRMRNQGDNNDAVRLKIEAITRPLTSTLQFSSDEVEISDQPRAHHSASIADLSLEQAAAAREIIDAVEQNSKHLMFLQGSAGTGKTPTVRVILSEKQRRHIRCLVSATTGIASVQYPGRQTVHSLFS